MQNSKLRIFYTLSKITKNTMSKKVDQVTKAQISASSHCGFIFTIVDNAVLLEMNPFDETWTTPPSSPPSPKVSPKHMLKVGDHVKILKSTHAGEIGKIVGYSTKRVFVKIDDGNTVWFDRKEVKIRE